MTPEQTASRTLVKSPPELWTECSDPASLARHLSDFGEIRITRLDPETAVAWEGERARGTVRLEPSGWGTRVVLTAHPADAGEDTAAEVPAPEVPAPTPAPPGPVPPSPLPDPEPPVPRPDVTPPGPAPQPSPGAPVPDPSPLPPAARRHGARGLLARLLRFVGPQGTPPTVGSQGATPTAQRELSMSPPAHERSGAGPEPPPLAAIRSADSVAPPVAPAVASPAAELASPASEEPASGAPSGEAPDAAASATVASLTAALDSLGQAHHRPFSRA